MGKMIDAQSIMVACAATYDDPHERAHAIGPIFRKVWWHSVAGAAVIGVIALLQSQMTGCIPEEPAKKPDAHTMLRSTPSEPTQPCPRVTDPAAGSPGSASSVAAAGPLAPSPSRPRTTWSVELAALPSDRPARGC